MAPKRTRPRALTTKLATAAAILTSSLGLVGGGPVPSGAQDAPVVTSSNGVLELRPLTTRDGRIVDDLGRDVLLRGANVNSLGEYWQGVPSIPATLPVTDTDWDAMASHGFSVVRLLITWSRVEPTRATIDQAYLDQVEAQVDAAADRGIYTVIDMHQDAYSATIFTTHPTSCPAGTTPAKGWDGAPDWATITDGLSTCLTGSDRNSSPAVTAAWNHFYDDTDGIRTQFVKAWAAVAERFAGRPEVAGYDLLNEPDTSAPAAALTPKYEALLRDTATAIRAAEASSPFRHLIIVEPAIPAGHNENGLIIPDASRIGVDTTGVVASVHNYAESITTPGLDVTIEAMNDLILQIAGGMGLATWGGEYGFWDTDPKTLEKATRYAADEDKHALGGAWWQWRQSCGDPHAVQWKDGEVLAPNDSQIHLNKLNCPDNTDAGANEDFLAILGRGYPRATPGTLTLIDSDPTTGFLTVEATAVASDVGKTIVVWTPTSNDENHKVSVTGLADLTEHVVPGGRYLTATVQTAGAYDLVVGPRSATPPTSTRPEATPAQPVPGRPTYTG